MKTATEKITTTKPQPKIKLNLAPASPKPGDDGDLTNPMKNFYSTTPRLLSPSSLRAELPQTWGHKGVPM